MIRTLTICLLILLCNTVHLSAQNNFPPVYEIKTDTTKQVLDSVYWQKLEDKAGKWAFEEVIREPLSAKFHIQGVKPDGIDTTGIKTNWLRYRLRNTMQHDARISITQPIDFFDLYIIKQDGKALHYRLGWLRKWEERDGLKSIDWAGALPIALKPGEEITVYERRNESKKAYHANSVYIVSTDQLIQDQYINYVDSREFYFANFHLQEAFILGLIFISILVSLFFYRAVKEKVYLFFAFYAFFLAINRLYNITGAYTQLYRQDLFKYVEYLALAWTFIPFFLTQFIRHFFVVKERYPKWDRFLFGVAVANLLSRIIGIALAPLKISHLEKFFYVGYGIAFMLIPISLIVTSFLYIKNKNRSYRYIATGTIPLMFFYFAITILEELRFPFPPVRHFLNFLEENFRLIEMILLCWLLVCFIRVLIMRFEILQMENINQALEKERMAKEKEIERSELIAAQKIHLETEVAERTAELKVSLEDLKATQSQLIQSEKMASLGELTAGIAHEIQNPLNFVNNFSEVSNELIEELKAEKAKPENERDKALEDELLNDIAQNLQKINHHGKRADSIVKGMLQHSRNSSGQKELTDINNLTEECLRLSFHGMRAKDKSFNSKTESSFDESLPKINIASQEIGRVLLNLFTNAFYSVSQKRKSAIAGYEPVVSVATEKVGDAVKISIKDNGMGVPQKVLDKIFQPFFTTKPTGEGTGLGLSMSYDIITKGHGGELRVETSEGEYAVFSIILPFKT